MASINSTDSIRDLFVQIKRNVIAFDVYSVTLMVIYSAMSIVFFPYIPLASSIVFQNILIIAVIVGSIVLQTLTGMQLFATLRYFYIIPVIYLMYDQTHLFVRIVHPVDYDDVLIVADRLIFGTDPTIWMQKFSFPALTEYLQICYFLFYVLPIAHAIELWRKNDLLTLAEFSRAMAFCFFVSYVFYFAMPAIGPRFTLHDFGTINTDLPGLFITNFLRGVIDAGGGIIWGQPHPADIVNRDCMPSGHTMITLANIILGFQYRSKLRWVFVVIGGSLIISTVYLRYHYAVDVLAGAVLAVALLPLEPVINKVIQNKIVNK